MAIVDRHGQPLAVTTHTASHHEVTLVQLTFEFSGNVGSWFVGNTIRPISSASRSLQPSASCSSNFEIGSSVS
jgi:hypothetical protein